MLALVPGLILLLGVPAMVRIGPQAPSTPSRVLPGPGLRQASQERDPFAAGRRWRHVPELDPHPQAWIPREACFVGTGELVWVSRGGGAPGLALHAAETGLDDSPALMLDPTLSGALGRIRIAAGDRPDELFALVQMPTSDPALRRTLVLGYDAFEASRTGAFRPVWVHEVDRLVNASGRIATSAGGELLAMALLDDLRGQVVLEVLDPKNGARISVRGVDAQGLRAFEVSDDGDTLVVLTHDALHVFDSSSGAPLQSIPVSRATEALSLSADGTFIVFGEGGSLRRFERVASPAPGESGAHGAWFERDPLPAATGELVVRAALDSAGLRVGMATWNPSVPARASLHFHDARSGSHLSSRTVEPLDPTTDLQNLPTSLVLSPDGERALAGFWGTSDPEPEVLLVSTFDGVSLLELDQSGSVESAALDPSGTRIIVAAREHHANTFSLEGALELHSTGGRDLLWFAPTRSGESLALAARDSGAQAWVFALGFRGSGVPLPGVLGGQLWLDPDRGWRLYFRAADGTGRADLLLPVPFGVDGALLPLGVQAASWNIDPPATSGTWRLGRSPAFPELF